MYDVAIIGCGIVGAATARELSKYNLKLAVIEKENDVANASTKANSAIIHAGYDPEPGTKMAKHNAIGSKLAKELCEKLSVPYKQIGSLVIAFTDDDVETINKLYKKGIENQIEGVKILNSSQVEEIEPNLNKDIKCALYAPTCAIVSPWEYAIALAENAAENGAEFYLNTEVQSINKVDDYFEIHTSNKQNSIIKTKYIINAAGVNADDVNQMVGGNDFTIHANKGSYYLLDKSQGSIVNHVIFQCPSKVGKGVLVSPTVHGNLIVGPDAQDSDNKENFGTPKAALDFVLKTALKTTDKINVRENIRNFAGLRSVSNIDDFIIEESKSVKGFINLAGIKSPGLSSAPSIALEAVEILSNIGMKTELKDNFIDTHKKIVFKELNAEEKNNVIKENPLYGRVICRCETVTEGEIVEALKSPLRPKSIDAVKRRCGAGMGRCQGGFCGPRVAEIIARELNIKMEDVLQDKESSNLLVMKTKAID